MLNLKIEILALLDARPDLDEVELADILEVSAYEVSELMRELAAADLVEPAD